MWRAGTVRNSSDGYCSENNEVQGIVTQNGDTILANKMILATGILPRYF
jgi:tRNA U34 5-carboxymethylaminomethyl modifying enzyme MnmG/GidA